MTIGRALAVVLCILLAVIGALEAAANFTLPTPLNWGAWLSAGASLYFAGLLVWIVRRR